MSAYPPAEPSEEQAEHSNPSLDDSRVLGIIIETATTLEDSEVKTPLLETTTNITFSIPDYSQSIKSGIPAQELDPQSPTVSRNAASDVQQTLDAFNEAVEGGHVDDMVFDLDELLHSTNPNEGKIEHQMAMDQFVEEIHNDPIPTWSSLEMPEQHWPALNGTPVDAEFTEFPDLQASQELRDWLTPSTDVVEEEMRVYAGVELVDILQAQLDANDALL
jgi:hypothetical protein